MARSFFGLAVSIALGVIHSPVLGFISPHTQYKYDPKTAKNRLVSREMMTPSEATSMLTAAFTSSTNTLQIQAEQLGINAPTSITKLIDGVLKLNTVSSELPAFDSQLLSDFTKLAMNPYHSAAIIVFALGNFVVFQISKAESENEKSAPYQPGTNTYDPKVASNFYKSRPFFVFGRVLKLASLTAIFNTGIVWDWLVLGKLLKDENYTALRKAEPRRAKEALKLCEQLGPTFIKLGQALSIRTDLIPEAYALELRQLQDAVPPFSSDKAYDVLSKELGVKNLSEIFSTLSEEPVASASIGQVYKGTLRSNGKEVAVKIQRPGILSEIAIDLHVLRLLTPIQTKLQNAINRIETTQEDIDTAILLVDEWGRGFVAETDYRLEARNTVAFEEAMRKRELEAVCAPTVVTEYTRDNVLITEWVQGTRLDRDASADVPRLCGVAINAYLTMLLDTGVLHCDPHPGNLLRTTDGKLCILDWGMTLEVPPNLQYGLLEFIAHINTENYDQIPQDFINLGFSPPDVSLERLQSSGITDGISFAFRQLSQGGGPKKIQERVRDEFKERYGDSLSDEEIQKAARAEMIEAMETQLASEGVDVKGVTNVMEEMSKRNRELFKLPPYVLYVARAFSTLEGIGLSIDDNYAIVQECYPYLARRLFTDRSPRAKSALKQMLGLGESIEVPDEIEITDESKSALTMFQSQTTGALSSKKEKGMLSPKKLIEMSEGFASYTAATSDVDRDGAGQTAAAAEFAKLFFDPDGSTLQDILVDETARLGDAVARSTLKGVLVESLPARAAAAALRAPKNLLDQSETLSKFLPDQLKRALVENPARIPGLVDKLLSLNSEDEKILSNAEELRGALSPLLSNAAANANTKDNNENVEKSMRSSLADFVADGAAGVPSISDTPNLLPLLNMLSDADTRKAVTEQLPGVANLGRRVGAGLLKRASYRAEKQNVLVSDELKRILIDGPIALANVIEPDEPPSSTGGSERSD